MYLVTFFSPSKWVRTSGRWLDSAGFFSEDETGPKRGRTEDMDRNDERFETPKKLVQLDMASPQLGIYGNMIGVRT